MTDQTMLVATRKGLFELTSRSTNNHQPGWSITQTSFLGDNVSMVTRDPRDGAIYAALDHGHFGCKMHRSDDNGATWTEIPAPAYPEGEMLQPTEMSASKEPKPCSLELIWAIEPGSSAQNGRIWAGTIPGGLFRSDDRGESWQLVRSLWDRPERGQWFGGGYDNPGIHSIIIDPRDDQHITLAVSCGGVWHSTDDGATWKLLGEGLEADYMPPDRKLDPSIQDAHLLVGCAADPDCMWIQHHNGIFRSTDGGRRWSRCTGVEPSDFGFAVAVDPADPETAWFVPGIKDEKRIPVDGRLIVTRTRDGGRSFDSLTDGLPQRHAYDLVFRHCLAIDSAGSMLAFGTTTGSLFVSHDSGESWQHITAHLPPIYAVSFV